MKNTTLYIILRLATLISWITFVAFLFFVYWNASLTWELFIPLLAACTFTVMLSRFRSGNY